MHNKATGDVNSIAACFHSWPRPAGQCWGSGQHGEIKQKLTKALGRGGGLHARETIPCALDVSEHSESVMMKCMISNKRQKQQILNRENVFRLHSYKNRNMHTVCAQYAYFLHAWNNRKICYICQDVHYKSGTLQGILYPPVQRSRLHLPFQKFLISPKATSAVIFTSLWLFHQMFKLYGKTTLTFYVW